MEKIQLIQISPEELVSLITLSIKAEIDKILMNTSLNKENEDVFLTRIETAEFFKVSLVTIHEWSKNGILKCYKMGNRSYYLKSELISQLMKSNRH